MQRLFERFLFETLSFLTCSSFSNIVHGSKFIFINHICRYIEKFCNIRWIETAGSGHWRGFRLSDGQVMMPFEETSKPFFPSYMIAYPLRGKLFIQTVAIIKCQFWYVLQVTPLLLCQKSTLRITKQWCYLIKVAIYFKFYLSHLLVTFNSITVQGSAMDFLIWKEFHNI